MNKKAVVIGIVVCLTIALMLSVSIIRKNQDYLAKEEEKFQSWKEEKTESFKISDASLTDGIRNAEKIEHGTNLSQRRIGALHGKTEKHTSKSRSKGITLPALSASKSDQYKKRFACETRVKELRQPVLDKKCQNAFDDEFALFSCGEAVEKQIESEIDKCAANYPLEEEKVLAKKRDILGDLTMKTVFNFVTDTSLIKSITNLSPQKFSETPSAKRLDQDFPPAPDQLTGPGQSTEIK